MSETEENVQSAAAEGIDLSYNKTQLKKFGIFTGMLAVLFGILLLFTLVAKKSWNEGLGRNIQAVLDAHELSYLVDKKDTIDSPFATSCASYSLLIDGKATQKHAVMLRVATIYGPIPCVFLYDELSGSAEFVDFSSVSGKASEAIASVSIKSQISYWSKRIPLLVSANDGAENKE